MLHYLHLINPIFLARFLKNLEERELFLFLKMHMTNMVNMFMHRVKKKIFLKRFLGQKAVNFQKVL